MVIPPHTHTQTVTHRATANAVVIVCNNAAIVAYAVNVTTAAAPAIAAATNIIGSCTHANFLLRNSAMDDSIGGS